MIFVGLFKKNPKFLFRSHFVPRAEHSHQILPKSTILGGSIPHISQPFRTEYTHQRIEIY